MKLTEPFGDDMLTYATGEVPFLSGYSAELPGQKKRRWNRINGKRDRYDSNDFLPAVPDPLAAM
jgi:hypothetical protein